MRAKIWSVKEREFIEDRERLMQLSRIDPSKGFENIGVQSNGTPVVFGARGNYGYLDSDLYRYVVDLSGDY